MAAMGPTSEREWAATRALSNKVARLGAGEKPVHDSSLGGAGYITQGYLSSE